MLPSFDLLQDVSRSLVTFLPTIMGIVLAIVVMLYALAYLSRYFEYLKMQESRWVDTETLEFLHRALEWVWVGLLAIVVLFIAQFQLDVVRSVLQALILRFPSIFFVAIVAIVAVFIVRVVRHFARYLRGELRTKPRKLAPPRLLGFMEIAVKYLAYFLAAIVAVAGAVAALPPEDQWVRDWFAANVVAPLTSQLAVVLLGLFGGAVIVLFVLTRLIDSVFEDLKRRSQRFGAHVLDQFKAFTKYTVYFVSLVLLLFLVMSAVLSAEQLLVLAVAIVLFIVVATLIAFDAVRDALAGITLMMADPFSVGDRVKIGDDLVGDVMSLGLTLTQLRTLQGEVVNFPNRELLATKVLNFSRSELHPIAVDLRVPFDVPHERVEGLLRTAAERTVGVEGNPAVEIHGKDLDEGGVRYQVVAYTRDAATLKETKSALIFHVQDLFHEAGITTLLGRG